VALPIRPLSDIHGFDRGTPVDRYYIERFLKLNSALIRGSAAELKDDGYVRRFGGSAVTKCEIIDIDRSNARATLLADLTVRRSLPQERFDCVICTQAVQFFTSIESALGNFWQSIRPGGALLLTAPAVGRLSVSIPGIDYWRLNPPGVRLLFDSWDGEVTITSFGNMRACLAMLLGEAAEELTQEELETQDPAFPLISCVVAYRGERAGQDRV